MGPKKSLKVGTSSLGFHSTDCPSEWGLTINYYVFPKIDRDEDGTAWAYDQEDRVICEVFDFSADDTEEELIRKGFAKCDAPGTETFLVEETAWEAYQERMANEV